MFKMYGTDLKRNKNMTKIITSVNMSHGINNIPNLGG